VPQLLPIFALDTVLMPGSPLPLHIFEPRYRQLLVDVQKADNPAFGIVCVRPPKPADSDESPPVSNGSADGPTSLSTLAEVGTLAVITRTEAYADGRSDVVTVGRRRFRLLDLEPGDVPYLQARVEWLAEDEGDVSSALRERAQQGCTRYLETLAAFVGTQPARMNFAAEAVALSYQVSNPIRLASGERQQLLEAETAAARLLAALHLLRRELVLLPRTRSIPVAPSVLYLDAGLN
jgi:Lon protease-like protein